MPYFDPDYFDPTYFDATSSGFSASSGGTSGATASLMIGFKASGGGESNNNIQLNPEYFISAISEAISGNNTSPSPYYNISLISTAISAAVFSIETNQWDVERFAKEHHVDVDDYVLLFNRRT